MTTASVLAPCKTCDLKVCSGPEDCPYVIKEEAPPLPSIKPAVHNQKYPLKIPNDISPVLKKANAIIPKDGKLFIYWDKFSERIKITIWDNSKKKKDRETILYSAGNKDFQGKTLHFRGNVLIKIQN